MRKIPIIILMVMFFILTGCKTKEYGYYFHFSVEGGNGTISVETSPSFNPTIKKCKDTNGMCELDCSGDSYFVRLIGKKDGKRQLTFIAIPDEGFEVSEWTFNGKVVKDNQTNIYTAEVTSEDNYNGVIKVSFKKKQL